MADEKNRSELLPCPFCGLPPMVYKAPKARGTKENNFFTNCEVYTVACRSKLCNVQPETREYTYREQAVEVWNERTMERAKGELEALKTDVKEHFRDICEICKYYEVHASECECECDVCSLDCVCSTCFDCNKWEWRGIKPNA